MSSVQVATEVPGVDESQLAISTRVRTLVVWEMDAAVFCAIALNVERFVAISFTALVEIFNARVAFAP